MISKNTRPYKAGDSLGKSLTEVANILYLLGNRAEFLLGLKESVSDALDTAERAIENKSKAYIDKMGGN